MDHCNDVLIQRNYSFLERSEYHRFLFLSLFDSTKFEESRNHAGGSYGLYGGEYSNLKQEREELYRQVQFDLENFNFLSAVKMEMDDNAVSAWVECMSMTQLNLFSYLRGSIDGNDFRLEFKWQAQGNSPLKKTRFEKFSDGWDFVGPMDNRFLGEHSIGIVRESNDVVVSGSISGEFNDYRYDETFFIPAYVPEVDHPFWYGWPSRLKSNKRLFPNKGLTSPNGKAILRLQGDGNLVIHKVSGDLGHVKWHSNTHGKLIRCGHMQPDGNFVLKNYNDQPVAATMSHHNNDGGWLELDDSGNLKVVNSSNWNSNTNDFVIL